MCGIVGIVGKSNVNQALYDALTVLQHRGQDAAGIVTSHDGRLFLRKDNGLVRDVFHQRHMQRLVGHMGIGHVRYPTAGSSTSAEAQPFYVNSPYGITLAHNGNLTNVEQLAKEIYESDLRHVNTNSDSEVLLNVFAHELAQLAIHEQGSAPLPLLINLRDWPTKASLADVLHDHWHARTGERRDPAIFLHLLARGRLVLLLDSFDEIKMCVAYKYKGEILNEIPASLKVLAEVEPVYETFPGWKCDISKIRKYEDLPENAKKYLTRMAEVTGIGLGIVSVGPNRDETIVIAKDIF